MNRRRRVTPLVNGACLDAFRQQAFAEGRATMPRNLENIEAVRKMAGQQGQPTAAAVPEAATALPALGGGWSRAMALPPPAPSPAPAAPAPAPNAPAAPPAAEGSASRRCASINAPAPMAASAGRAPAAPRGPEPMVMAFGTPMPPSETMSQFAEQMGQDAL